MAIVIEKRRTKMARNCFFYNVVTAVMLLASARVPTVYAATSDWDQIIAAAKREGKIALIGPPGAEVPAALTQGFQKKYPEIQADFNGLTTQQATARLRNELAAGINQTDIFITGTTTALDNLLPAKAIVPIKPLLVGPNVLDTSKWRGEKFLFSDDAGTYNLVFTLYVNSPFTYNINLISPGEITSWKDLLKPQWKNRVTTRDPTVPGGALTLAVFWYSHEGLGKDFIQKLFANEIVVSRDDRQMLDFAVKGKYPIAIGASETLGNEMIAKGLPLKQMDPAQLRESTYTTPGNGTIVVIRNAPHPNAIKLFLDYLLSREGQTTWSKASGFPSLRQDVPRDHVVPMLIPKEGVRYQEQYSERFVEIRRETVNFLRTIIAR
jgi:ABC-type Fe3+ transport system substrate-binding protein